MILTIILFLFILGILVFVHEFGHFTAAKKLGVKVEEFAFGFKPRVWGIKRGETTYAINAIPVGGYVSMYGEEKDEGKRSFMGQPRWARAIILLSGVAMNFVLAWVLFTVVLIMGFDPLIPGMVQGRGVRIIEPVKITSVEKNSPAEGAGLKVNDRITAVNNQPVGSSLEVISSAYQNGGKSIRLQITRDSQKIALDVVPRAKPPKDSGPLGIGLEGGKIGAKWYQAPLVAVDQVGKLSKMTVAAFGNFIKNLFVKQEVSQDVTGMVGVGYATDFVRKMGFTYVLQFIGLISLSLGVMNLLPIVPLDGGHVLIVAIESIRRKKLTDKQVGLMSMIGLGFILLLIVVTTYSDILRFSVIDSIIRLFKS